MTEILPFPGQTFDRMLLQTLHLLKVFSSIDDEAKRALVIEFVEGMAAGKERPDGLHHQIDGQEATAPE